MQTRTKLWSVALIGWAVPGALIVASRSAMTFALAAVAIAWWHGYMAAKLEAKLQWERETNELGGARTD